MKPKGTTSRENRPVRSQTRAKGGKASAYKVLQYADTGKLAGVVKTMASMPKGKTLRGHETPTGQVKETHGLRAEVVLGSVEDVGDSRAIDRLVRRVALLERKGRIVRVGNSQGVRITKEMLEAAGMSENEDVTIEASEGELRIIPSRSKDYEDSIAAGRRFIERYRTALKLFGE